MRSIWSAGHFYVVLGEGGSIAPHRFAQSLASQLSRAYKEYASAVLKRVKPEVVANLDVDSNWGDVVGIEINNLFVKADPLAEYNLVVLEPLEELLSSQPHLRIAILVDEVDEAERIAERVRFN